MYGGDYLGNREAQFREPVPLHPQTHRILPCTENLNAADAVGTVDLVGQIDVRVVGEKSRVVGAFRRIESDQHQRSGHGLLYRYAVIGHIARQLRSRLRLAHLRQHEVRIRIGLYVIIHDQAHQPVGRRVQRIDVIHIVDAAHLPLDRRRDRLLDSLCIRAHIRCEDLNFRRNDVWKLGHGKRGDGHCSHNHHEDGDNHGHDRPIDEKLGHWSIAFRWLGLFDFYGRTVLYFLQPFYDHQLTLLDAAFDNQIWANTIRYFYCADADLVVGSHHRQLIGSLQFGHGFLRYKKRGGPYFL